jgi:hypothetical protein
MFFFNNIIGNRWISDPDIWKKWGTGASLILTFWCFLTHLCITHRVHTSIYKNKHGVCLSMCVSHGVLRFNTMAEPAAVRNWDQTAVGFLVFVCLSICQSFRPSVLPSGHRPFPVGSVGGGGMGEKGPGGGGTSKERPGEGGGARAGKDRAGGNSMSALCTGFTLVFTNGIVYHPWKTNYS